MWLELRESIAEFWGLIKKGSPGVWEDLCHVVNRRAGFTTLDTHEHFHVRLTNTPAEGLMIGNGEELFVPQDAVLEAWQHLRSVGFLSAEGLTHGLDFHANKVISVLAVLPYLKPVQLAIKQNAGNGRFKLALQFVPRADREQMMPRQPAELVLA